MSVIGMLTPRRNGCHSATPTATGQTASVNGNSADQSPVVIDTPASSQYGGTRSQKIKEMTGDVLRDEIRIVMKDALMDVVRQIGGALEQRV